KELLGQTEPTWDGQAANANWDNVTNWVGDALPAAGTNVTFYDSILSGTNILANGAMRTVNGLRINDNADTSLNLIPDGSAANHLTINGGGVAISSGSGGSHILGYVTLGANQTWTNDSAQTFSITNRVRGAGNLTKTGTGTVQLNYGGTASDFSGTVTVNNGPLRIVKASSLGSTAAGTTVSSGGALELAPNTGTAYNPEPLTLSGTGVSNGGALRNIAYNNAVTGTITLGAATRINSDSSTLTLSNSAAIDEAYGLTFGGAGDISVYTPINTGASTLTKDGAGRLTLSGNSGYTGLTALNEGVIRVAHQYGLGWLTIGTTVSNGTALELIGGITIDEPLTLNGTGIASGGALRNISGNTTFGGAITLASASRINSDSGTLQLGANADISGAGIGLTVGGSGVVDIWGDLPTGAAIYTKDGTGTNTLNNMSAIRTWSGATTISAGMLQVTGADALSSNSAATVSSGATLDMAAGAAVGSIAGAGTLSGGGALMAGGNNTSTTFSGPMTGGGGLTKVGTGTLTLSYGASTRNGNTTVSVGTLIQNGTNASSPVTVSSGAFLYGGGEVQNLTVNGRVSAGTASNTVGALKASWLFLENNGTLQVELSAMTGTAGVNWDVVNASGALLVNAADGSDFIIALKGNPAFVNTVSYTNTIMTSANLTSFATNKFTINTTEFTPPLGGGSFSVNQDGNNIRIIFTAAGGPTSTPYATSYTVGVANAVSDGQITSGAFAVAMNFEDSAGMTTNANYDLLNATGTLTLTNEQFATTAFQNSGKTLVASDATHAGYYPGNLGTYTSRWSAQNSNSLWRTDSTTLSNGTQMTFTVIDDDTNYPHTGNSMLLDPGVEIGPDGGGTPDHWWLYGSCGQYNWAARSGSTNGMAWKSWTVGGWGGFGQTMYVNLSTQAVVLFTMWGKAETGFASTVGEAWIKMEFYSNTTFRTWCSNSIYSTLTNNYNNWTMYSLGYTNTLQGIDQIKVTVGSGNWVGGAGSRSVVWDDAVFSVGIPLQMYIGTTNFPGSDRSTNAQFILYDSQLASITNPNPWKLVFEGWDDGSGINRSNNSNATNMNVDIGSWITDNVTNYVPAESSAATLLSDSTNVWKFTNALGGAAIDTLVNAGTNLLTVSLFDSDNDRANDSLIRTNHPYGLLVVRDDDTARPFAGNVLYNPGFEIGYWGEHYPWHWSYDNPDTHAGQWGDVYIAGWNTTSGTNELYFSNWNTNQTGAGFWQEVTNSAGAGAVWYGSAWCFKDTAYTNVGQQIAIEFYNAGMTNIGGNTNVFSLPNVTWTLKSVMATSPANTVWARLVINTWGQGPVAALQFDDLCLMPAPAMRIKIGGTYLTPSDYTTNALFYVDYNALTNVSASNPFYMWFAASDPDSGVSRGTTDANSQMNVDFGNVCTDDVAHYVASNSTPDANTKLTTATNAWVWYSFTAGELSTLNNATNRIAASVFDADNDRSSDRLVVTNQQYGFLVVTSGVPPPPQFIIYDWFPNSGRLYNQGGGTGWRENWVAADDDLHVYSAGSFPTNKWSCHETNGNKALLVCTSNGAQHYASRMFSTNFTAGKVYAAWMQSYDHKGESTLLTAIAGIQFLDSATNEKPLIGKVRGTNALGFRYCGVPDTNSSRIMENGIGTDYFCVAKYDFSTRELSASAYSSNDMVAEEPAGYWDLSCILTAGCITSINGIRIKGGVESDPINNVGNVYFDEIRVGTNWYEVARLQGESNAAAMAQGPWAQLIFLGTNYGAGSNNSAVITDAMLVNTNDKLDFAVWWTNTYGVFLTNADNTFNIGSRAGRVCPNWDPWS
ncbi:MAG: autotransporter-associated beta strand repeat-containing protein, partial [Verrucomicrobiota bacterium]